MTLIAATLQAFFTDRLGRQRQASPRTVAAYRDALRLLLVFVQQRADTAPANLDWTDLDAETVSAFLNHLEDDRGNSTRTRNVRLTAIRSCSPTQRSSIPNTPCSSSVSWTSRPNGSTSGSSPS